MGDGRWGMARTPRTTTEDKPTAELPAETLPAEPQPAATPEPAPAPEIKAEPAPIKPGVRKITLAQARAHQGKA